MYRFPVSRRRIARIKPAPLPPAIPIEKEIIGTIQGITPHSKEEWRVANALYKMGHDFIFQHPVMGGWITGGQVVDFWITSTQLPTPLFVHGIAWHNNKNRAIDDFKYYKLKKIYHGLIRPTVIIWDYEVPTISAAINVLRRKI